MNKRDKYSFSCVIGAATRLKCEDLHHKKAHQHAADVVCPAEYELSKHIYNVRKYVEDQQRLTTKRV